MSTRKEPKMHLRFLHLCVLALILGWGTFSEATILGLSKREIHDVTTLARAIASLQPRLGEEKYVQHALSVYRAAKKYRIDPRLLIAIAQQETSFRENLPEGAAGEIGICQIRKNWLRNKKFKKEFGSKRIRDLQKSENNFMYAAWILRDLKNTTKDNETVPWWTYYNARKLKNRVRYFMYVNKKFQRIVKFGPVKSTNRILASATKNRPDLPPKISKVGNIRIDVKKTARRPKRVIRRTRKRRPRVPSKNRYVYHASVGASARWISDAVESLAKRTEDKNKNWNGHHSSKKRRLNPSLQRTVNELGSMN